MTLVLWRLVLYKITWICFISNTIYMFGLGLIKWCVISWYDVVRLLDERYDIKSHVNLGGFPTQLQASYVSSHTEDLWYNERVCLWMTIYIYIYIYIYISIYVCVCVCVCGKLDKSNTKRLFRCVIFNSALVHLERLRTVTIFCFLQFENIWGEPKIYIHFKTNNL